MGLDLRGNNIANQREVEDKEKNDIPQFDRRKKPPE